MLTIAALLFAAATPKSRIPTPLPPTGQVASIILSVELIPAHVLPGVPTTLHITAANVRQGDIEIPNAFQLEFTHGDDPPSIASFNDWPVAVHDGNADTIVIPGGESVEFYVASDATQGGVNFFADSRLSQPGAYELRIEANAANQVVYSDSIAFVVDVPQGDDAGVWLLMKQMAGPAGWNQVSWGLHGGELADAVAANFPNSSYWPYVVAFKLTDFDDVRIADLQAAIARNPAGPIKDQLQLLQAQTYDRAAGSHFFLQHSLTDATPYAIAASSITTALSANSAYPFIRDAATTLQTKLLTVAQMQTIAESRNKAHPSTLGVDKPASTGAIDAKTPDPSHKPQ